MRSRLRARRAAVWSAITFAQARHGQPAVPAAQRALAELTAVRPADLGETNQSEYADAVLRVSAIRWATAQAAVGSQYPAAPPLQTPTRVATTTVPLTQTPLRAGADNQPSPAGLAVAAPLMQTPVRTAVTPVPLTQTPLRAGADNQPSPAGLAVAAASMLVPGGSFTLSTTAGAEPGQTCLTLEDSRPQRPKATLARRCTFGIIWLASAQTIPQTQALVLSVQPLESWRELWVFHQIGAKWLVDVISPGLDEPDEGYVEYAGFAPGTSRILLVREVKERNRFRRWFEEVRLDDLVLVRQASTPELLRDFGRWQDVRWRRDTLALR
jgi:hypothetical protein